MTSVACLRKSIFDVIKLAGTTDIVAALDNIFSNHESSGSTPNVCLDGDNITPLMLACDMCSSEALIYLRNQISALKNNSQATNHLIEVWGHPHEESYCGNRAAHHALASGFTKGLDLLENILGCLEEESRIGHLRRYLSLLSVTNKHGDTPLMMACWHGHGGIVQSLFPRSVQLALSTRPYDTKASINETWQLLKEIIRMRNNEGCTALNLAVGHGYPGIVKVLTEPQHVEVQSNDGAIKVNLLIGDRKKADAVNETMSTLHKVNPLAELTLKDLDFCKKTLQNLDSRLKIEHQSKGLSIEELSRERKKAEDCLAMIEFELERLATNAANELLLLENTSAKHAIKPIIVKGATKRAKKKKGQKRNTSSDTGVLDSVVIETRSDTTAGDKLTQDFFPSQSLPFITQQDGTLISKHHESKFDSHIDTLPGKASLDVVTTDESNMNEEAKKFQRILRATNSTAKAEGDIAALMESLCLKPAMLLLSSHGMAVDMSPCQLDAIASILSHQLRATSEAQQIQRRLLEK